MPSVLMKIIEGIGYSAQSHLGTMIMDEKMATQFLIFVRWQQCEVNEDFYRNLMKGSLIDFLQLKYSTCTQYNHFGKSSSMHSSYVTDGSRKNVWFMSPMQLISVDHVKRKPIPYSDRVKEYFKTNGYYNVIDYKKKFPNLSTEKYDIPEDVKIYTRACSVSGRHVDFNNHVNSSAYLEFCFDCLAEAVPTGFCANMTDSIFKYPVRRYSILYLKESKLDDNIDTIVWQDDNNPWVFHFHVLKNIDQLICQAQLQFYHSDLGISKL